MISLSRISLLCGVFFCFCSLAFSDIRDQRYTDAVVALESLAYYQFNETEVTILYDSTSHNIDGTYLNDPSMFYLGVFNPTLGTVVGFYVTDDYIEVANMGVLDIRRQVPFSFWLEIDSYAGQWTIYPCVIQLCALGISRCERCFNDVIFEALEIAD